MDSFKDLTRHIFIIAEIGNNHNGDMQTACDLIDVAADAGVDAVKFQTFRGIDIVTPEVLSSEYPGWDVKNYKYWYEFLDTIALPLDKHKEVFDYAKSKNLIPFSTSSTPDMADFLSQLDVPIFKIASMDVTNTPLLRRVAGKGRLVILSTGMVDEVEVRNAAGFFPREKLALLHCVSNYPLEYSDANLNTIKRLKDLFGCTVGFSDHSLGYDLSIAAVALGAKIIEKHITLDRNSPKKAEHHFALEPQELRELVSKIRKIESAMGVEAIILSEQEKKFKMKAMRSLHLNRNMAKGNTITKYDISVLRPSNGAPPEQFNNFVGKRLKRDKKIWSPLIADDI